MRKILIIGATSAIAEATARLFAKQGDSLHLLGRNTERLETLTRDLLARGAGHASFDTLDINRLEDHDKTIQQSIDLMTNIDIVLICHGTLPDQKQCETDVNLTIQELNTNAVSTISLLTLLANIFEKQMQGTIAVISSVAGDRGRQSNYLYGAAKGAISIYLQGMRNRLFKSGIQVLTIKPGFVDTPMTANFEKGFLWVKPEKVAHDIVKAIDKNKDVIYTPRRWLLIMLVIKLLPEWLFKRMSL